MYRVTPELLNSAIKAQVDVAVASEMSYKGGYNADTNTPDLDDSPAAGTIAKGDTYTVEVAGTFYGVEVNAGDMLVAEIVDAGAEADWTIVNRNLEEKASEISVEPDGNMTSDNVQTALHEHQGDIDTLNADSTTVGSVDEKIKVQVTDKLVDNVVDGGSTLYLSAEQGKLLKDGKLEISVLVDEDDMVSDSDTKLPTQQSVKAYVDALEEKVNTLKTNTELYLVENDGDTVFTIANTTTEPLTVTLEGFPIGPSEYDRDATGITFHDGLNKGEQVFLLAHNG